MPDHASEQVRPQHHWSCVFPCDCGRPCCTDSPDQTSEQEWDLDQEDADRLDVSRLLVRVVELNTAELTCASVPVQIEGEFGEGQWYYFRYRHGWAGVGIGRDKWAAVDDWRRDVQYGGRYSGDLSRDELLPVFVAAWEARKSRFRGDE